MQFVLKLIVGCGLLTILFFSVDWPETWNLVANAHLGYLCMAFLLFPLGLLVSAWKWQVLIRPFASVATLRHLFFLYYIGFFANNFLPTNVGGDLVRFVLAEKLGERSSVGASVLVERLSGVFVLFFWAFLSLSFGRGLFAELTLLPVLWVLVASGLIVLCMMWWSSRPLLLRLEKYNSDSERIAGRFVQFLGKMLHAVLQYRNHGQLVLEALAISVIFYVVPLLLQLLLFKAISVQVPFLVIVIIVPIILVISVLPVSFNGLGLAEGAIVILYAQAGVPAESAFAVAILARLLQSLASLSGGCLWFFRRASKADIFT